MLEFFPVIHLLQIVTLTIITDSQG